MKSVYNGCLFTTTTSDQRPVANNPDRFPSQTLIKKLYATTNKKVQRSLSVCSMENLANINRLAGDLYLQIFWIQRRYRIKEYNDEGKKMYEEILVP